MDKTTHIALKRHKKWLMTNVLPFFFPKMPFEDKWSVKTDHWSIFPKYLHWSRRTHPLHKIIQKRSDFLKNMFFFFENLS